MLRVDRSFPFLTWPTELINALRLDTKWAANNVLLEWNVFRSQAATNNEQLRLNLARECRACRPWLAPP